MKKFYGLILGGILGLLTFTTAHAQIDGVSFSLSPNVSYNWWNENIALKNSPFYGVRLGIGFGPYVELQGSVEKSINLKQNLEGKSWNILNEDALNKLQGMQFDVTRVGGNLKFNILNSSYIVSPYLTLGGGVQLLNYNPLDTKENVIEDAKQKEKQIYLLGGVGVNFNLSERVALSIEGRNIQFNMGEFNYLVNRELNNDTKKWGNWSALASLDIKLGGYSRYNDKTMKYSNLFEDGFRGAKFVLEPGLKYIDFNEKMGQPDQWFIGGSAGVDFSSLIGLRAFYYQGTKDPQKLSFDFNKDLKVYGGNLLFRLNQPRGIVPYLTLGAGYLDDKSLIPTDPDAPKPLPEAKERFDEHNLFLMGGAGIEVPLSRYIALFGNVDALLSSGRDKIIDTQVENVFTSIGYTAGIRFNIGAPAREAIEKADQDDVNDKVNDMRSDDSTRRYLFQNDEVYKNASRHCKHADLDGKMMTKQEFEDMVDRILAKIRSEEMNRASKFSESEMDIIVAALNAQNGQNAGKNVTVTTKDASNDEVVRELRRLVDRMDRQQRVVTTTTPQAQVAPVQRIDPVVTTVPSATENSSNTSINGATRVKSQYLKLNRLAILTGVNFGEGTQWELGIRGYLQISDTDFDFVPELMMGFGKKSSFDLSSNVIYNIRLDNTIVDPYVGLGVGLYSHGNGLKLGTNVILGSNFKVGANGEIFADYTARGLFKNNQIAVGYRFVF